MDFVIGEWCVSSTSNIETQTEQKKTKNKKQKNINIIIIIEHAHECSVIYMRIYRVADHPKSIRNLLWDDFCSCGFHKIVSHTRKSACLPCVWNLVLWSAGPKDKRAMDLSRVILPSIGGARERCVQLATEFIQMNEIHLSLGYAVECESIASSAKNYTEEQRSAQSQLLCRLKLGEDRSYVGIRKFKRRTPELCTLNVAMNYRNATIP